MTPLFRKSWRTLRFSLFWAVRIIPLAVGIGSVCAFFLWSLNSVTQCRFDHPWFLFLLPLAGLGIGLLYHHWGKSSEGGNNLILEQIHEPGAGVPRRMVPLILFTTLVTHLFGGSVGREGTAVQMGGSMASAWGKILKLHPQQMRVLLICGVAAGFKGGEVTPLFFIGTALGNALAGLLGGPTDLFAALGFVAIFAGASNTPLACTLMGMELFGLAHGIPIAMACLLAYWCSGQLGIYRAQRSSFSKKKQL